VGGENEKRVEGCDMREGVRMCITPSPSQAQNTSRLVEHNNHHDEEVYSQKKQTLHEDLIHIHSIPFHINHIT
jgi:hypothetical protein